MLLFLVIWFTFAYLPSVLDRPHDALEDDIDINNWSYLDQTAPSHDLLLDQETITVTGEMQMNEKGKLRLNLNNAFRIRMMILSL